MVDSVQSKNNVPIRLTDERWAHITEEHCELAGMRLEILDTITNPVKIVEGREGECLALREINSRKYIVVVYRESDDDGFIITAFLTRNIKTLLKRKQIWPK